MGHHRSSSNAAKSLELLSSVQFVSLTWTPGSLRFVLAFNSGSSNGVKYVKDYKQLDDLILEENKTRCSFFKQYKFNESEKLGMVSYY